MTQRPVACRPAPKGWRSSGRFRRHSIVTYRDLLLIRSLKTTQSNCQQNVKLFLRGALGSREGKQLFDVKNKGDLGAVLPAGRV